MDDRTLFRIVILYVNLWLHILFLFSTSKKKAAMEKLYFGILLSGLSYFTHVKYVARVLENLGCDSELIAAGFLHDVIEDTDTTYKQVEKEFGKRVADIF